MTLAHDTMLQTYNREAKKFAEYFAGIEYRNDLIDRAFAACRAPRPKVLELGCGDGRDAVEILKHTTDYMGTDYAEAFIALARQRHPDHAAQFQVADMRSVFASRDTSYDIIFAFSSLLHLDIDEIKVVLRDSIKALNTGGLLVFDLKFADSYTKKIQRDQFGERVFYYYHPDEIVQLIASQAREIYREVEPFRSTTWSKQVFQKS